MSKVRDRQFWESAKMNNYTFKQYYNRLVEIALSRYEYEGFPDTVDTRYLELALFSEGQAVLFYDEVLGYLGLRVIVNGKFDVYRIPVKRRALGGNGSRWDLTDKNSVIVYNNYLRTPSMLDVEMYSKRLYNLDRTMDVNINAQKTPVLVQCSENQRLTMKNLYMKYEGNEPFIFGDDNLNPNGLKVLQTGAPFIAGQLYDLRVKIWNEALTFLGIYNIDSKKERAITSEVDMQQGGVLANRFSGLAMRQKACKEFSKMFGKEVTCKYRDDVGALAEQLRKEVIA